MAGIVSQKTVDLFLLRGAYGYKGFSEKVGENLYKSDSKGFWDAIENGREPINPDKISSLSSSQIKILNRTSSGNSLIPLLNRMGQLGMMDLREGLVNPKIIERLQSKSYASTINAYKRSI